MKMITETSHVINITLNVSINWEVSDEHCCEEDPYEVSKPISAAYSVDGGEEAHYYFGMVEDNLIEEAIANAIQNRDITNED